MQRSQPVPKVHLHQHIDAQCVGQLRLQPAGPTSKLQLLRLPAGAQPLHKDRADWLWVTQVLARELQSVETSHAAALGQWLWTDSPAK